MGIGDLAQRKKSGLHWAGRRHPYGRWVEVCSLNYVSWRFAATESVCLPDSGQMLPLEASQGRAYDFYRCIGMVDDISAVALKGQRIFNELRYLAWLAEASGGL